MIRTIIFDLDGTLIESLTSIVKSMNDLLEKEGYRAHSFDSYRMFVGDGVEKLVERSFPGLNSEQIKKYTEKYIEIYIRTWREKTVPFPGIKKMLTVLQNNGKNLFILSNKRDDLTKLQTAELFPDTHFHEVRGAVPDTPKKPDPSAALQMLKANDLVPGESIFIGDSGVDMEAGVNSRMITGGVLWGFRSRLELTDNGALHLFETPEDIVDLVCK